MWLHQVRGLRHRARLIAPDFPAHGASSAPEDPAAYSEAAFARHALALLDSLQVERAFVVGHSMGGAVALKMGIEHPDRVAGLLLANTGGGSGDRAAARVGALATADLLERQGMTAFVQAMLSGALFSQYASHSARALRHMTLLLKQHSPQGLARVQRGIHAVRPPIQERDLEAVRAPTTVVVGSLDAGCLAPSRLMAERIAGARYFEVPGVGHMSPLEAPRRFNEILENALSRAAPSSRRSTPDDRGR